MTVRFENFIYSYYRKGKPVYAPSDLGRRIGKDIKARIESAVQFDDFYFHLKAGGHVAAIHLHRPNRYFARVDIENFFYCIGRNRVVRCLKEVGIERPDHYARWSCVKNPYGTPSYALPYGFVQSPIVATLLLMRSALGEYLKQASTSLTVSVYMDDISLSSNDLDALRSGFDKLLETMADAQFPVNNAKVRVPGESMDIFNCDLAQHMTVVSQVRQNEFLAGVHTPASEAAFAKYCEAVEEGNNS